MSSWFLYAVGAALLYGLHQIFTKIASDRISDGLVAPDAVLVETNGQLGSLLFRAENLPAIAATLANKPK